MATFLEKRGQPIFHILLLIFMFVWRITGDNPRNAPFCIDADNKREDLLYNSERLYPIIKHLNEIDQPVEVFDPTKGNEYVKEIGISRMTVNDENFKSDHILTNLRNWIHITIRPTSKLVGLYIQAIKAPLGVPFGNFIIDFECMDCYHLDDISNGEPTAQVVPCKGRPQSSARHPNVLVMAGQSVDARFVEENGIHFHFNWIEAPCDDVPMFQFLILAVKKWEGSVDKTEYKVFFSPLYENIEADTWTGVPWPIDPTWKHNTSIFCHDPAFMAIIRADLSVKVKAVSDGGSGIIKMNPEYDKCIMKNEMQNGYQCPPGPFICQTFPNTFESWVAERRKDIDNALKTCTKCKGASSEGIPTENIQETETSTENLESTVKPDSIENEKIDEENQKTVVLARFKKRQSKEGFSFKAYFDVLSKKLMEAMLKSHGVLMIFCWIAFCSISNYLARFHKEATKITIGSGCFGLGSWLWGHSTYSYLSLCAMWGAIFILFPFTIIGYHSPFDYSNIIAHKLLGGVAMIMFHTNQVLGWWRPLNPSARNTYILVHVILGYGSKVLAIASCFLSNIPMNAIGCIVIGEIFSILMYLIATLLQKKLDNKIHVDPPRQLFPVPEGIDTFDAKGFVCPRRTALFIQTVSQFTFSVLACLFLTHSI